MKTEALRAARRTNLRVALEAPGIVKKEIGQKMGWADGSFIGQMASGKRPITEELARQLEEHLGLPEKSLDMPPRHFELMNPKVSTPEQRMARNVSAAVAVLAEQLRMRPEADAKSVGTATAYIVAQAQKMGALSAAQVKEIVDKMLAR